jgi:hypothetical protein
MECCNATHFSVTLLELYIIMNIFSYGNFVQKCAGVVRGSVRGLLEKYPTFGREKETGLLGALDT